MRIMDIMTPNVITITAQDTLATAIQRMEKYDIRHLIVVNEAQKPVGVVSDRDCRLAIESPFAVYNEEKSAVLAERIPVQRVMTHQPVFVSPLGDISDAAHIMVTWKINSLPVIRDDILVGIITSTDLIRTLTGKPPRVKIPVVVAEA